MRTFLLLSLAMLAAAADATDGVSFKWLVDDFRGDVPWTMSQPPSWATLSQDDGALTLTLAAGDPTPVIVYRPIRPEFAAPESLALTVESSVAGVGIVPRLRTGEGWRDLPSRTLAAGAQRLQWERTAQQPLKPPVTFWEWRISRSNPAVPATLRFTGLAVVTVGEPLSAIAVSLATGPIGVARPGQPPPAFRLRNPTSLALPVTLAVRLEPYQGAAIELRQDLDLAPEAVGEWRLPAPPAIGSWYAHWTLSGRGQAEPAQRGLARFAVLPEAKVPGRERLWSVCTHSERFGRRDASREIEAQAILGVRTSRVGDGWAQTQPAPDTWNWERNDWLFAELARVGIEPQFILAYGNPWAARPDRPESESWKSTPRLEPWRAWVKAVATRYHDRVRFWEVWNEPDIGFFSGTTEDYIGLLRGAHEEIKAVDPKAVVMTGGFATLTTHGGRGRNPDLMSRVVRGEQASYDVIAFHQHGDFQTFQNIIDGELAEMRRDAPGKPLWFNETAWSFSHTGDPVPGERQQADELVKKVTFAFARGAIGYTWYDLRNDGDDPGDGEHNFGLVTRDFTPKHAFAAYHHIMRLLGDAPLAQVEGLGRDRWGFTADLGDRRATVLWSSTRQAASELALAAPGGAELRDAVGAPLPLHLENGRGQLRIGWSPVFLITRGAAPGLVPLAGVIGRAVAIAGRQALAEIELGNPDAVAHAVTLTWPGVVAAKPVTSEVPARGRQRLSIEVPVEAVRARTELPLDYAFAGTSWRGRLTVPVQPGLQLGASVDGRDPDLVLDRREQQVSLCENDPNLARCLWKGPDDLSAKVWLAVADGQLRLRIEVRDDVHRQSHNGSTLWQGDSVQLGIAPAEGDAFWELCLARRDDGNDVVAPYSRPAGRGPLAATMRSSPIAGGLRYEVVITLASLGLDGEGLARGLRFNLLANDDDEGLREGWLELAPGIGQAKTAVEFVPVVLKR